MALLAKSNTIVTENGLITVLAEMKREAVYNPQKLENTFGHLLKQPLLALADGFCQGPLYFYTIGQYAPMERSIDGIPPSPHPSAYLRKEKENTRDIPNATFPPVRKANLPPISEANLATWVAHFQVGLAEHLACHT